MGSICLTAPICVIGSILSVTQLRPFAGSKGVRENDPLAPVQLIALSQNCDARRLPGCVNPLLDAPTCEDVPTFGDMPSQIPPDVAALHGLRFSLRGMPVQMRGKQAFGVWQYTFITGQRKSAEPAKTRLCAGVICCLVLGAGLDVQQPHDSGIISAVLFKLLAQRFNLWLAAP